MKTRVLTGYWMVLVPGAVAYLRYKGESDPTSADNIYDLFEKLGFLKDVNRNRRSVLNTIRNRLNNQFKDSV